MSRMTSSIIKEVWRKSSQLGESSYNKKNKYGSPLQHKGWYHCETITSMRKAVYGGKLFVQPSLQPLTWSSSKIQRLHRHNRLQRTKYWKAMILLVRKTIMKWSLLQVKVKRKMKMQLKSFHSMMKLKVQMKVKIKIKTNSKKMTNRSRMNKMTCSR